MRQGIRSLRTWQISSRQNTWERTSLAEPTLTGIRWAFLAAFFGLTAAGLFSHLRNSRSVARAQFYTAVNIYLLLGLLWATLYLAIDAFSAGSIQIGNYPADRRTELLYFSLVTLSTIGYGDIVPLSGEARILAALEGVTGVLYIAITWPCWWAGSEASFRTSLYRIENREAS